MDDAGTLRSPIVYLVGESYEGSIAELLSTLRVAYREFANMNDFLTEIGGKFPAGCVVTQDEALHGLDLLQQLNRLQSTLPVIITSRHATTKTAVRAMQEGASTVLVMPVAVEELYFAIRQAFAQNERRTAQARHVSKLTSQFWKLSNGEQQVIKLALAGKKNREIAQTLEISVRTVEARKKRAVAKTNTESMARLLVQFQEFMYLEHQSSSPPCSDPSFSRTSFRGVASNAAI